MSHLQVFNNIVQVAEAVRKMRANKQFVYCCFEEFVAKWGMPWVAQPLPDKYPKGTPKLCYSNAASLALTDDNLVYVEGYGGLKDIPMPIQHAWCVEKGSDRVIEVTSDNFCEYWGVPFNTEYLQRQRENEATSLLDDYHNEFPLMKMADEQVHEVLERSFY